MVAVRASLLEGEHRRWSISMIGGVFSTLVVAWKHTYHYANTLLRSVGALDVLTLFH